jgi:hypothetical protein
LISGDNFSPLNFIWSGSGIGDFIWGSSRDLISTFPFHPSVKIFGKIPLINMIKTIVGIKQK